MAKETITYYYLKTLDGKYTVFRRIEQPKLISIEQVGIASENEEEIKKKVDGLNENVQRL